MYDGDAGQAEAQAEAQAPQYKVLSMTMDEWIEIASAAAPWLIEPIIAARGVSILSGVTGSGKSLVALDAVMHLITVVPNWHGNNIWQPTHRNVLYIDAENHESVIALRLAAWADRYELTDDWVGKGGSLAAQLHYVYDPNFTFGKERELLHKAIASLSGRLAAKRSEFGYEGWGKYDLVVVDTLATASAAEDTNSQAEMRHVFDALDDVARLYQCPILLLAHPSKEGGSVITDALSSGGSIDPNIAVAGSQHVGNQASVTNVMASQRGTTDVALMGMAKCRIAQRSARVLKMQIESEPITLNPVESEDGQTTERIESAPVLASEFGTIERVDSKFGEWANWLREKLDDSDAQYILLSASKKSNGCPVAVRTARDYAKLDKYASARNAAGISVEVVERSGGGHPEVRLSLDEAAAA